MLQILAATGLALAALAPAEKPQPVLVQNIRLTADADASSATVLIRDGRIERVHAGAFDAPVDARTIDGEGALLLPAFIDAYSFVGCATPEPRGERDKPVSTSTDVSIDMREANRKGIQPAFRVADVFDAGDALEAWRSNGFGALLSAPAGQLLAGQSVLVVTRDVAPRDAVLVASVFDQAGLRASGSGYPGTLMGSIAQLRQFFLDAQRYGVLSERRAEGKSGARLPYDADLLAAQDLLSHRRVVCCAVDSADDIERFVKLADAHGFDLAIAGGREAWRRAAMLAERKIPVILVPPGGDEPADPDAKDAKKKDKKPSAEDAPWTYTEPVAAKREKRRAWVEQRDGARVLAEAGVHIAFGTGKGKADELVEHVRKLVEAGLPREVALAALTGSAAEIVGAAPSLGRIAVGADATFALWTKDPLLDKEAAVRWLFVDGYPQEFEKKDAKKGGKPDEGVDAGGVWTIEFDVPEIPEGRLEIEMAKDGSVEGQLSGKSPGGDPVQGDATGAVRGRSLKVSAVLTVEGARLELVFDGELDGDTWTGTMTGAAPEPVGFHADRTPKEKVR